MKIIEESFGFDKAIFVKADVSDMEKLRNAFEQCVKKFGNIDILINNAGICDESQWEKEISVNVASITAKLTKIFPLIIISKIFRTELSTL